MGYGREHRGSGDKEALDKIRRAVDAEEVEAGEEDAVEPHEDCAEHPELAAACERCRGIVQQRQAPARKKDTRRWCRGRVGVPHEPEWVSWSAYKNERRDDDTWRVEICTVCRKELRHDFPWRRAR